MTSQKLTLTAPELHLISISPIHVSELLRVSLKALPYLDYIHVRDKQLTAKGQLEIIQQMFESGIPLNKIVVNDRLDVALAARAVNVHLAGHSLPVDSARPLASGMRLGRSVHSVEETVQAAVDGADYCLFGHVYDTSSKPGLPGRGLAALTATAKACPVPMIAIGGIRPDQAGEIIRCGAQGIAVMTRLFHAPDPAEEAQAYRKAMQAAWLERR
ncbi:thiamine phosphate synthase [Paenibacillus sp. MB22_1]|uniref:thiamine phosphate synthase n=1 Tax=unclassified Paenibacillus TaxID=185978 RepID=UPI0001AFCD93|nr:MULTISPECIES: thiamine phosphate synthase [unclassified Paenibacillus]EES73729.1 putative thiamine-phosphate diphosphorylase [Paenibacillus sp. oral taxon 786 str. D14]MCT2196591.1 thiamine phosphate synthase [Paenibacillus sp. p3-SID1389]